jgi:hypothetical protein
VAGHFRGSRSTVVWVSISIEEQEKIDWTNARMCAVGIHEH